MTPPQESRLEVFSEHFVRIVQQATVGALYLVIAYPGLASLISMVQAIDSYMTGRPTAVVDFLDAGGKQPVATLLLRMIATLTILTWLLRRRHVHAATRIGSTLSLGLLLTLLVSAGLSQVKGEAGPETLTMAFALGLYSVGLEQFGDRLLRRNLMVVFALSAALASWTGLALYLHEHVEEQLTGAFFQPNVMAAYLTMALPVTLALCLEAETRALGAMFFLFALGDASALLLTISRAGWGTAAVTVFLFVLVVGFLGRLKTTWRALGAWVLLSWLLFALLGSAVSADHAFHWIPKLAVIRAENGRQEDVDSGTARAAFRHAAVAIWKEHPAWGVGLGAFNRYYPQHQDDFRWYSRYSHCMYLDWLAEGGTLAFMLFMGLVTWTLVRGVSRIGRLPASDQLLQVGIGLGLLASLVHSAVDVDFKFPALPVTFFLLAALFTAEAEAEDETEPLGPGVFQLAGSMGLLAAFVLSFQVYVVDSQSELADALSKANKPDVALQQLEIGWKAFPYKAEVCEALVDLNVRLADSLKKPDMLDAAARWADLATRLDPHRSVSWSRVGEVARLQGNLKLEKQAYETAVQLDPVNFPEYYDKLALLAERVGNESEALRLWDKATVPYPWKLVLETKPFRQDALRPQLVEAWMDLGMHQFNAGRMQAALDAYLHVLEMEPHSKLAQLPAGACYVNLNQPSAAVPLILEAIDTDPKDAAPHKLLATCYLAMGKKQEAREQLEAAIRLDPSQKDALQKLMPKP